MVYFVDLYPEGPRQVTLIDGADQSVDKPTEAHNLSFAGFGSRTVPVRMGDSHVNSNETML